MIGCCNYESIRNKTIDLDRRKQFTPIIKMMTRVIYIVSAFALFSIACADPLQRINDYLVEHEPLKKGEKNVECMKQMLADKDATKSSLLHKDVKPVLEELIKLPELSQDCSLDAYGKLSALSKQISGHQRRIDNVIKHFLKRHSVNCEETYKKKIEDAETILGEKIVDGVEKFSKQVIDTQIDRYQLGHGAPYYDPVWETSEVGLNVRDLNVDDGVAAYWTAFHVAEDEPTYKAIFEKAKDESGKLLYNEKDAKDIFERRVVQPCRQYVQTMHDAIIVAKTLDQYYIPDSRQHSYYINTDFLFPATRFHLCNLLLQNEKDMLKGYIRVAKKRLEPEEW